MVHKKRDDFRRLAGNVGRNGPVSVEGLRRAPGGDLDRNEAREI